MRWFKPRPGEKQYVKRFALFPIIIGYEVRWLETCYIEQIGIEYLDGTVTYQNLRFMSEGEYELYD